MWRQNLFLRSRDSGTSIADDEYLEEEEEEEELEGVTVGNSCTEKLQSLLSAAATSKKEKAKIVYESEVKMERLPIEGLGMTAQCRLRNEPKTYDIEESISDEDNPAPPNVCLTSQATSWHKDQNNHIHTSQSLKWSSIVEEANELVYLQHKNRSTSAFPVNSNFKRRHKYEKSKKRPEFSVMDEKPELHAAFEETYPKSKHGRPDRSMAEHFDVFRRKEDLSAKLIAPERIPKQSIFSLFEKLEEMHGRLEESTKVQEKGYKKTATTGRRTFSNLGNRSLLKEHNSEHQDNRISSDDEDQGIDQHQLNLVTGEIKGKTMVDLLQEVCSTDRVGSEYTPFKQSGIGYHGRLQEIMQVEKDCHAEFLKKLQTREIQPEKSKCIDVQILSRLLDAKLTVCHCMLSGNNEILEHGKNTNGSDAGTVDKTVIFHLKICDNVELEVGNMIRIHPPWKEVQVSKDDEFILCTYFSQIMS